MIDFDKKKIETDDYYLNYCIEELIQMDKEIPIVSIVVLLCEKYDMECEEVAKRLNRQVKDKIYLQSKNMFKSSLPNEIL